MEGVFSQQPTTLISGLVVIRKRVPVLLAKYSKLRQLVRNSVKIMKDQFAKDSPAITRSLLPQNPVAIKNAGNNSPSQSISRSVIPVSLIVQLKPDSGNH